jgi:hypothetical protein
MVAVSDQTAASESVVTQLDKILVSLADSIATLDSVSCRLPVLLLAIQDQPVVTDGITVQLDKIVARLTDTVSTVDSTVCLVGVSDHIDTSAQDTARISDGVAVALSLLVVAVSDVATATEQVARNVLGAREVSVGDAVSLGDSTSSRLNFLAAIMSDATTASDVLTAIIGNINVLAQDTIAVSDAANALRSDVTTSVQDIASVSDLVAAQLYYTLYEIKASDRVDAYEGATVQAMQSPHGASPRGGTQGVNADRHTENVKSSWRNTSNPTNRNRG